MPPVKLNIVISDPVDLSACSPSTPSFTYSHNRREPPCPATHRSLHFSPSVNSTRMDTEVAGEFEHSEVASESDPLVAENEPKKPFYRARPLWLVPFAISSAVVRGMTLAPRIEVFTQLSCSALHVQYADQSPPLSFLQTNSNISSTADASFYFSLDPLGPHLDPGRPQYDSIILPPTALGRGDEEDPRRLPSQQCLGNPAVQAGAARLQTTMTTTMGLLSALSTGWWGHYGERNGRTKVLAGATLGLFLTDLTFILVSTPGSIFASHGHKLLFLAPVIEGLLGGWSTLQSATSAYLSDCTSSGSRAFIFSRFWGVFYFGFSVGPAIGGYLIRNPIWTKPGVGNTPMVTTVFWVATICSFINFILVLFLLPESLDKVKRERAVLEYNVKTVGKRKAAAVEADAIGEGSNVQNEDNHGRRGGIVCEFLQPLRVFLPVVVMDGGVRRRRDWSLTFLAAALFGFMLSQGVHQMKYLYAGHVYAWGAEQLSYYMSFLGGARAVFLLFLLPYIIAALKPKVMHAAAPPSTATTNGKKPKPTKANLAQEIKFDLILTRCSFMIDLLSHVFVMLSPMPSYKIHGLHAGHLSRRSKEPSQALFVLATSLSSLGTGAVPAIQSLALCILQVRALDTGEANGGKEEGIGTLFGALAVLQAVGQMILGPMLFGLIYSGTVAVFPKAIFVTAAGILVSSLTLMMLVRGPKMPLVMKGKGKRKAKDVQRGRSRVRKDLRRGGATRYGTVASGSSPTQLTT